MYESDKVLGMFYPDAVWFIDRSDLWDEVAGLVADEFGMVVAVYH